MAWRWTGKSVPDPIMSRIYDAMWRHSAIVNESLTTWTYLRKRKKYIYKNMHLHSLYHLSILTWPLGLKHWVGIFRFRYQKGWNSEAWRKWTHLADGIFLNEKVRLFITILMKFVLKGPKWERVIIDSGNGLAPMKPHAIIWTNEDPVSWRIYTSTGLKELIHQKVCMERFLENPVGCITASSEDDSQKALADEMFILSWR